MKKKELNVGLWLIAVTVVSIVSAVVITDWHSKALWVIICLVFWSAVVFGALFVLSALIIGIIRIPLPEESTRDIEVTPDYRYPRKRKRRRRKKKNVVKEYDMKEDHEESYEEYKKQIRFYFKPHKTFLERLRERK